MWLLTKLLRRRPGKTPRRGPTSVWGKDVRGASRRGIAARLGEERRCCTRRAPFTNGHAHV